VHKNNKVGSIVTFKRIPELLNTLRKEGFARVHQRRKGDALKPSGMKRERSLNILVECKECAEGVVSPSYKLRRKSMKFPGGNEKVHKETMNFKGFQEVHSRGRVCAEFCKECRRNSRIA
jgi:hypothetical protein